MKGWAMSRERSWPLCPQGSSLLPRSRSRMRSAVHRRRRRAWRVMYDGQVWTGAAGYATVTLPNSVTGLNMGFHYQLTVLDDGDSAALVQA